MSDALICPEAYPSTEGLCRDAFSLQIISCAYATPFGELNSALQELYHAQQFRCAGMCDISRTLKSIALADINHLDLLAETISALGASPVYTSNPPSLFNFYSTKFVSLSCTPNNMLEDDVISKRRSIKMYERMLCRLTNCSVKAIIARVLLDEKLHLKVLCDILNRLC